MDFPLPLAPTKATVALGWTEREKFWRTGTSGREGYEKERSSKRTFLGWVGRWVDGGRERENCLHL